ncbi:MAG TPA: hypothetical protein VGD01_19065 [Candidatus Elarobacter sp.]|jgi:hypothetical protein
MFKTVRGAAVLCAALLAACGGGGGRSAVPPPPATPAPGPLTPVSLAIVIPTQFGAAKARKPQFVSPATATVSVVVNGGAAQTFPVAGGTSCAPTGTTLSGACTVYTVNAPVGPDTFTVTLLDSASHVLSQGTAAQTIVLNTTNTVTITFDGVVAALRVGFSNASPPAGTPARIAVTLLPVDAAGFTLVGAPGTLPSITVSDADTSGATGLYLAGSDGTCATQAAAPAASVVTTQNGTVYQQVCLSYTGAATGAVTVSASTSGGISGSAPFVPSQGQAPGGAWVIGNQPSTNTWTLERVDSALHASVAISGSQTNFGQVKPTGLAVDPNGNVDVLIKPDVNQPTTYAIAVYSGTNGGNVAPASVTAFTLPNANQDVFFRGLASDTPSSVFVLGAKIDRGTGRGSCTIYRVALSGGTVTPSAVADCSNLGAFVFISGFRGDRQHVYLALNASNPVNLPGVTTVYRYLRNPDGSLTAESGIAVHELITDIGLKPNGDVVAPVDVNRVEVYPASGFVAGKITQPAASDVYTVASGGTLTVDQLGYLFIATSPGGSYDSSSPEAGVIPPGSHAVATAIAFQPFTFAAATTAPPASGNAMTAQPSSVQLPGPNTVTVTENGYTGPFGESDNCANIATVQPSTGTGPSAQFTIVAGRSGGTCTIVFGDAGNVHTATVQVGNTATVITGQSVRRQR